ncbi:peptide MFS transporter [Undibacterium sp. TJN25]|uniref:peptide MFS transporter n=1 Tax=Undibacterium sp. TJN25 TaxID=3413056 RepID=UPI003BF3CDF8
MLTLKQKISQIPDGAGALFFIQIFATLGFAVLYSTLVLYATKKLGFSNKEATAIMGVFGAFNYGLHLFGGYLAGRFLSNRNLFVGGMVLQVLGCFCISGGGAHLLYWGLALFLTGSGLNVTCLNLMLTQRFKPEDTRRESAFLWNYAGMNLGFFIGFSAAGYYQLQGDYSSLFIFATIGNFLAIVLAAGNWKVLRDLDTPLLDRTPSQFKLRFAAGMAILVGLVPVIYLLLQHSELSGNVVITAGVLIAAILVFLAFRHKDRRERNNMWAYMILTAGSLVFWTLYQMSPSGLQIFATDNVNRMVWGIEIAPQWIQNINSFIIMIGGPLTAILFDTLRKRGWNIDLSRQFAAALILIGIGFLALPLGISLAGGDGVVGFKWVFICYLFQSLGELLISPVGYAMVGRLAPRQYQGIMMGSFMLVTGVASVISSWFSGLIPDAKEGMSAVATNPTYNSIFSTLGWSSVGVGVVMVALIPFLRKIIKDVEAPEAGAELAALPVAEVHA